MHFFTTLINKLQYTVRTDNVAKKQQEKTFKLTIQKHNKDIM